MVAPLDYRSAIPDLSSSSPLHNLTSLSSSPPLSPQSPTPLRSQSATRPNGLRSPITSNPDPFSGNAKAASLASHPRFGKDQLRSKHLRHDPVKAGLAGLKTWVLPASAAASAAVAATQSGQEQQAIDDALHQHFFDSSDDNPSSDWSVGGNSVSTAPSSMPNVAPGNGIGLGIEGESSNSSAAVGLMGFGEAFQDGGSPSIGRKTRVRTFSRTQSSSKDPFSASSSSFNSAALESASPGTNRQSQRRRLTGSSPKKLSRTFKSSSSHFNNISSDDSSGGDDALPAWEERERVSEKPMLGGFNWNTVIEQVFEKVDGSIELSKRGLTRIDPIVADLAKFVSIPPLRKEDSSQGTFSRTSSLASAFERTTSSTSPFDSPKSRSRAHTSDLSSSSNLKLYLAGNRLHILPSAFFELHNLVVLIVRDNGIEELPPAIGQLVNLKELNVSQNGLRHLPAEIQKLNLDSFVYFPNPFQLPPSNAPLSLRRTFSQILPQEEHEETAPPAVTVPMGPPLLPARAWSHSRLAPQSSFALAGVQSAGEAGSTTRISEEVKLARYLSTTSQIVPRLPSLTNICVRVLLEPEEGDTEEKRILLEMFESGCLVSLNKSLDTSIIKSLEAARRSAVGAWGRVRPASTREGTWCSGAEAKLFKKVKKEENPLSWGDLNEASNEESAEEQDTRQTALRVQSIEEQLDKGDDSRRNPWFNRCPNIRHHSAPFPVLSSSNSAFDWPGPISGGKVFYQPSVQRLEWVSHIAGVAVSQIRLYDVAAGVESKKPIFAHETTLIPLQWRGCGPSCLDFL